MKALFAKVTNIKAFPSTGMARVEIEAPYEQFAAIVSMLHERQVLVTVAPKLDHPYGVIDGAAPEVEPPAKHNTETPALGPLAKWAVMRCKDDEFVRWLEIEFPVKQYGEYSARELILKVCRIGSRKELDANDSAAEMFDRRFRKPFAAWMHKEGGV